MLEKIKNFISAAMKKVPSFSSLNLSMNVVYAIGGVFGFAIFLFFTGWLYEWYRTGHADLQILISFFERCLINSSAIMAFTWLGKALTDKNKNGIPDPFENNNDSSYIYGQRGPINNVNQNNLQDRYPVGQTDRILSVNQNGTRPVQRPDQNRDPELQE